MRDASAESGRTPREISYAWSARSRAGRALIRSIENLTGRPKLIRMALGYEREVSEGRNFFEVMTERYRVTLDVGPDGLGRIPADGPLVIVANHPFGILDGLAMGRILAESRPHFRIVAHKVFHRSRELENVILPISFDETKAAVETNLETRRAALSYLAAGGAVGIFPGGTVSTAKRPFGWPMDPVWRTFTARLVARSGATVVPVFFHGANSRMFQLASHLHPTLRVALLIKEFGARVGGAIRATIGEPLSREDIRARAADAEGLMDWLRERTYALSPDPLPSLDYGYEFEAAWEGRGRGRRSDAA